MRGKVYHPSSSLCLLRITPAHAGKRFGKQAIDAASEDHPRACGEKFLTISILAPYLGSPPRMRGKDNNDVRGRRSIRITPAHAGKRLKDPVVTPTNANSPLKFIQFENIPHSLFSKYTISRSCMPHSYIG